MTIRGASVTAISRPPWRRRRRAWRPRPRRARRWPRRSTRARPAWSSSSTRSPPSRRTRTRVPCWGTIGVEAPGPQVVDQAVEALRGDVAEEPVVHLQTRGPAAVGHALGLLQGEHPVGRGGPGPDAQGLLRVVEQLVGAAQHAGDVGAHRHHVGPHRLGVEHVVEVAVPSTSAGVIPTSSAISSMASGRSQPSCSWARWQTGISAERGCG